MLIPETLWVQKWLMTIFLHCFPYESTIRVWDFFLAENIFGLLKISVALLDRFQTEIFQFDAENFSTFLRQLSISYKK